MRVKFEFCNLNQHKEIIMSRIVMKFGGTSVGDVERIARVARLVAHECSQGHEVAVVVSAMSGETNKLVALAEASGAGLSAEEFNLSLIHI